MFRKEDITTIFMDVDDTLLDFKECAREDVRNCCLKNGITYSDGLFDFFLSPTNVNIIASMIFAK